MSKFLECSAVNENFDFLKTPVLKSFLEFMKWNENNETIVGYNPCI